MATMLELYNAMVAASEASGIDGGAANAYRAKATADAFARALVATGPLALVSDDGTTVLVYKAFGGGPWVSASLYYTLGNVPVPTIEVPA